MVLNLIWMSIFVLSVILAVINLVLDKKILSLIACIGFGLWYIIFMISIIINGGTL